MAEPTGQRTEEGAGTKTREESREGDARPARPEPAREREKARREARDEQQPDKRSRQVQTDEQEREGPKARHVRVLGARGFEYLEESLYVAVAIALAAAGAILFGYAIYSFVSNIEGLSLSKNILEVLDALLLVFIISELIHTIRASIVEHVLRTEPFLIVGIVAAIRRLVVISVEAKDLVGTPEFADAMLEIGILTGAVLLLGVTMFLLRRTGHGEPRPSYQGE